MGKPWGNHRKTMGKWCFSMVLYGIYHLVMTNIAMENPRKKWWFLAGNIIYKWASYTMAMLNNQMVYNPPNISKPKSPDAPCMDSTFYPSPTSFQKVRLDP